MAIETPLWMDPNPATGVTPEFSARADRGIIAALFTEGVADVQAGDLAVTQRAAGANMTVTVATGAAYVAGDDTTRQGTYRVVVTAAESVTIPGAPSSGSRIDLVVLRVYDGSANGGSRHGAAIEIVTGTASGSPAAPNLPPTAVPLARVAVAAGQSAVATGNITDARPQAGANTLKVGTQAEPMTVTQRDSVTGTGLFAGRMIENTSAGRLEHYTGSAWVPVGTLIEVFSASGTWTKAAGAKAVTVFVFGAGGSGASAVSSNGSFSVSAAGGAGGARAMNTFTAAGLPSAVSVTVAAGPSGVTTPGSNNATFTGTPGLDGGASTFGAFVAASGGAGGIAGGSSTATQSTGGSADYMTRVRNNGLPVPVTPGDGGGSPGFDSPWGGGGGGHSARSTATPGGAGSNGNQVAQVSQFSGANPGTFVSTQSASVTAPASTTRTGTGRAGDGGGAACLEAFGPTTAYAATGAAGGTPAGGGGGALHYQSSSSLATGSAVSGAGARGEIIVVTTF